MNASTKTTYAGCARAALGTVLLLWLGLVPVGVSVISKLILEAIAGPRVVTAVAVAVTALFLLPPLVCVALFTRRRAGWQTPAALAAAGTAIGGYLLLDATVQTLLPKPPSPALYGEGAVVAAARLGVLLPYLLLAAWLIPHLAGVPRRSLWAWLGLDHIDLPTLLLALAVAALVISAWPVTGALGDSLTSLSLIFQTLVDVTLQTLLVWGIVFCLLNATFPKPWTAAITTILLYSAAALGKMLHTGDVATAWDSFVLLPLAFLLTELRARRSGIYPLVPMAFCFHAIPALFVDPRDVLASGIPEMQHVLSHAVGWSVVIVAGPLLWGERKLLHALRDRVRVPTWARLIAFALVTLILWLAWGGMVIFAGKPGFYDDGFLIILEEQADLGNAYAITDREARVQYVYDTLVETAERTQAPLREELDRMGVPYRPYYIVNMIRVDGHRWLLGRFQNRPGVAQVIFNPNVREYPNHVPLPYGESGTPPSGVQSNLAAINADDAWDLRVTGEGIVVAGQDTGYDWTHPALKPHYRGWDGEQASHDYNWLDAWDDTAVPFDDDSHGTHTMGTVLGDDGGRNQTGVAPDAKWMGCRNMRRGVGNPGSYAECMEFFLAPYPHGGDPFTDGDVRLAPQVINNSWGCPYWEGCFAYTLEPAVEALRAAGIMMVVSAGNEGPACSTVTDPPANYAAAFSIAATDDGGYVTSFSSRGPVGVLTKPDVSAPGDYVRSSVPGGGYGYAGGTSMAGPHVAGVVALLWSADPTLIGDIDATERLICETAAPKPVKEVCTAEEPEGQFSSLFSNPVCACGGVSGVPNNVYGCGFIDAGAAVEAALERRADAK
ncbi:MAG: S8 family serine peptidase [Anaerolineae bacterium]|nr:S8 family serine peptidase [Anaerolineae bacterium]